MAEPRNSPPRSKALPTAVRCRPWPTTAGHGRDAKSGRRVLDYGNNLRQMAFNAGYREAKVGGDPNGAWVYPGFVPAYIRPLFCEWQGPFRWVALSGDPKDIWETDQIIMDLFPEKHHLVRWIKMAQERVAFQGLPSRICWLGYGERDKAGLAFNEAVASGRISAPIVIGRDHLDCGSVASPNRETEGKRRRLGRHRRLAPPQLCMNAIAGRTWISYHHAAAWASLQPARRSHRPDGTPAAARRLKRVYLRSRHGHHAPRRRGTGGHPFARSTRPIPMME